ncbi:hypothetical protein NQK81_09095 [Amycolatopsis roodepoortensis]|uniref:hypothetical protein n=1 Tax=Amycolatopsis roodepoortensis TaxID=700274 RepID=UPI00214C697D|nr:hypothetical protein [Amycolatopsis roodepoortensis]UUV33592.1 hypothetical protein NQK81_09095 [Amycolatopsis roodepoortensis]
MNAKPTRTQAAVAVFGACSVGAQVVAGANGGITAWQLTWMLAAMITFAGGAIATESLQKRLLLYFGQLHGSSN